VSLSDVVTIDKTGEYFRLIYDVKGRFTIHRITADEAKVSIENPFALFWLYRSLVIAKIKQDESSQNRADIKIHWYGHCLAPARLDS
jgi:Ribosomal family S4e